MPKPFRAVNYQPADAVSQHSLWRHRRDRRTLGRFSIAAIEQATGRLLCVAVAHPPSDSKLDDGATVEISLVATGSMLRHAPAGVGPASASDAAVRFLLLRVARLARRRGAMRIVARSAGDELAACGFRPDETPPVVQAGSRSFGRLAAPRMVWCRTAGAGEAGL